MLVPAFGVAADLAVLVGDRMPNGGGYRGQYGLPSPDHTSDSDETWCRKQHRRRIARKWGGRWREFARRKRTIRVARALSQLKLLPANFSDHVVTHIAQFIG